MVLLASSLRWLCGCLTFWPVVSGLRVGMVSPSHAAGVVFLDPLARTCLLVEVQEVCISVERREMSGIARHGGTCGSRSAEESNPYV